jgi:hypothetical protein
MRKLTVNAALPAMGIVLAALVQLALTTLWPGIKVVPSLVVSIDSYFVVLLTVGLCFIAGGWAQRNVPTTAGAACAVIAPLAWLGLLLKGTMTGVGSIAWLRPLTLFTIFTALAPLIGVALGWAMSLSNWGNVQDAV